MVHDLHPEPILAAPWEPRSSIELWSTSRGRQQRVKVYAGTHPDEIDALIEQATDAYDRIAATDDSLGGKGRR
jgi:hypothetical protein